MTNTNLRGEEHSPVLSIEAAAEKIASMRFGELSEDDSEELHLRYHAWADEILGSLLSAIQTGKIRPRSKITGVFDNSLAFMGKRAPISLSDAMAFLIGEGMTLDNALTSGAPENNEIADFTDIPGKLPNISVGRLAILAAWQIECEIKRAASRDEVMARLQKWATDGIYPETLIKAAKEKRAVEWNTTDMKPKIYDIEACGKALKTWIESRA